MEGRNGGKEVNDVMEGGREGCRKEGMEKRKNTAKYKEKKRKEKERTRRLKIVV